MSSLAPLVTIVTPSYNQGHFIRATIESVLAQDYPHIEYIVMDAGSSDATAAIASEYSSRLTFISERDRGQSDAINKGFQRGRGQILAWLNSDDVYLPRAVSAAVRAFAANPACGMVYGEGYTMNREGVIQGRFPHSRPFDLWRLTYLSDYILQQSSFYRRSALDQVGYLDESLHFGMDWDLFVRIGMRYPVAYVTDYLGCIREYAETKSASGALVRAHELHRLLRRQTGLRLPPGSIVYAGETYWREAVRLIDAHTPRGLGFFARAARFGLQVAAGAIIGRTLQQAQELYSDGWAGPRLRLMLRAGRAVFTLRGAAPGAPARMCRQRISITANGRPLGRFTVAPGEFELRILVPPELEDVPLRIEANSARSFRPSLLGRDRRRLAFLYAGAGWAE
jgi:glycosyltransferase involved in cell wall biosynthesis